MWKKVLMGILLVLSATAGFFVAKAQVLYNNSLNQINRDYDTALANVDLSGIHVNSDDQIVNILVIGNDYRACIFWFIFKFIFTIIFKDKLT